MYICHSVFVFLIVCMTTLICISAEEADTNSTVTTTEEPDWKRKYPCHCADAQCGCCTGNIMENFNVKMRQRVCANFTYDADEFAIGMKLLFNDRVLYNNKISGNAPFTRRVCGPLTEDDVHRFCTIPFGLRADESAKIIQICVQNRIFWGEKLKAYNYDCLQLEPNAAKSIPNDDLLPLRRGRRDVVAVPNTDHQNDQEDPIDIRKTPTSTLESNVPKKNEPAATAQRSIHDTSKTTTNTNSIPDDPAKDLLILGKTPSGSLVLSKVNTNEFTVSKDVNGNFIVSRIHATDTKNSENGDITEQKPTTILHRETGNFSVSKDSSGICFHVTKVALEKLLLKKDDSGHWKVSILPTNHIFSEKVPETHTFGPIVSTYTVINSPTSNYTVSNDTSGNYLLTQLTTKKFIVARDDYGNSVVSKVPTSHDVVTNNTKIQEFDARIVNLAKASFVVSRGASGDFIVSKIEPNSTIVNRPDGKFVASIGASGTTILRSVPKRPVIEQRADGKYLVFDSVAGGTAIRKLPEECSVVSSSQISSEPIAHLFRHTREVFF